MNKTKKYKISIIIPCYSVGEDFLNEALNSIKEQTYRDWEIILVDDCSPKQEWKSNIVKNLIKENKLKLINNKKNYYAAESRNIGLRNSSGEIILFLDADDKYTNNNFFKYIIQNFKKNPDLDLIVFKHSRDFDNKKNENLIISCNENYFPKIRMKQYIKRKDWFISPCFQALKKDFLKKENIKFLKNKNKIEDWIFCYQIFTSKPNVLYTENIFYFYRKRIGSTTFELKKNKDLHIKIINSILLDIETLKNIKKGGGEFLF